MTRFFVRCLPCLSSAAMLAAALPAWAQSAAPATDEEQEAATVIEAQQMQGRLEREVILEGDVETTRPDLHLTADRARYDLVEDEVHIVGQVWMKRPGQTYSGDELRVKMDTGTGYVLNPTYQM